MDGGFLTTSSTEGLEPLGEAHQRSYELISGTVSDDRRLGARHSALFAEPRGSNYGDRIDWYASTPGRPRPLEALDEEERAAAEAVLEQLSGEIRAVADEKLADKDTNVQSIGEALANALRYPGPGSVYVVGSGEGLQPVLVNWAWVDDNKTAVVGDLSGSAGKGTSTTARAAAASAAAAAAAAAAPVPPPAARRRPAGASPLLWWLLWLGWLLLALMIGAILYLMVEACALRLPGLPSYCPPPGPTVSEVERRAAVLRDRIAAVERQVGIADRACQPRLPERAAIEPLAPPTPVPEPAPQPDQIDQRLDRAGAQQGDLTFSLVWDGTDDLDLHVTCPGGQRVFYNRRAACGGRLDIDSNGGRHRTRAPVENTYFNGNVGGTYKVRVNLYDQRTRGTQKAFRLRVRHGGDVETLSGSVSRARPNWTYTYRARGN